MMIRIIRQDKQTGFWKRQEGNRTESKQRSLALEQRDSDLCK